MQQLDSADKEDNKTADDKPIEEKITELKQTVTELKASEAQMNELTTSRPDNVLIRKQTVEHPYGTIKCWMGATHFLTKRLPNVSTVMSLHVLAYNLKRMISILRPVNLIAAIRA